MMGFQGYVPKNFPVALILLLLMAVMLRVLGIPAPGGLIGLVFLGLVLAYAVARDPPPASRSGWAQIVLAATFGLSTSTCPNSRKRGMALRPTQEANT